MCGLIWSTELILAIIILKLKLISYSALNWKFIIQTLVKFDKTPMPFESSNGVIRAINLLSFELVDEFDRHVINENARLNMILRLYFSIETYMIFHQFHHKT